MTSYKYRPIHSGTTTPLIVGDRCVSVCVLTNLTSLLTHNQKTDKLHLLQTTIFNDKLQKHNKAKRLNLINELQQPS